MANDLFQGLMALQSSKERRATAKREELFDVQFRGPLIKAQTDYQNALTSEMMDVELRDLKRQASALKVKGMEQEVKLGGFRIDELTKMLHSGDEEEAQKARDIFIGYKSTQDLSTMISAMRLQNDQLNTMVNVLGFGLRDAESKKQQALDALGILVQFPKVAEKIYGDKSEVEKQKTDAARRALEGSDITSVLNQVRGMIKETEAEAPGVINTVRSRKPSAMESAPLPSTRRAQPKDKISMALNELMRLPDENRKRALAAVQAAAADIKGGGKGMVRVKNPETGSTGRIPLNELFDMLKLGWEVAE